MSLSPSKVQVNCRFCVPLDDGLVGLGKSSLLWPSEVGAHRFTKIIWQSVNCVDLKGLIKIVWGHNRKLCNQFLDKTFSPF